MTPGPCPDHDALRRLASRRLEESEATSLRHHADACPVCQAELQALLAQTEQMSPQGAEPGAAPEAAAPTLDATVGGAGAAPPAGQALPAVPGYDLLAELGRGGMCVVYKARHRQLQRVVALKMILAGGHASDADVRRFRAEAEAIARVQHPHVVQIYRIGDHGGRPFFALEFVDGGSLAQKLGGKPQPVAWAAELLEKLARGVHAAHEHGIIHRDLKPANVLLTADGTPKVADFGLAKALDAGTGKTQTGAIVGTPSYMAPEQAAGQKKVGPAADVYALGALLYECLTGRPPFQAATPLDTVLQVVSEEAVPPRQRRRGIPRDLETICLKCLEKDLRRRYATALELAEELRRFRAGEPVRARPAGPVGRAWKWARRRPLHAAGLLVLLTGLGVLGGLYGGAAFRLATHRGQVVVDSVDPGVSVVLRRGEQEAAVLDVRQRPRATLAAGDYEASLVGDPEGLELLPPHFTLTANGREVLQVRREPVGELQRLEGHQGPVAALALSPDGRRALSGSGPAGGDRTLRLWDLTANRPPGTLGRLSADVLAVAFAPDGRLALSGGADGRVRLWDTEAGREVRAFEGHAGAVAAVAFAPDGRSALSGGADATVRLWDVATGKEVRRFAGHTGAVAAVAFSPDGKRAVSGGVDRALRLWDVETGRLVEQFQGGPTGPVRGVAFAPDGRLIASGGEDDLVRLWDAETGRIVRRLHGHTKPVTGLAFTPDGRQVVSASADRTVRVWDVATGRERQKLTGHGDGVLAVAVAPDGRHALSAGGVNFEDEWVKGRDFSLRWWAVPRARAGPGGAPAAPAAEVLVLRGHTKEVLSVVFSPDGDYVLSGGSDSTVRLWDAATGVEVRRFTGVTGGVLGVAFSPDGRQALSGSDDTSIRLWDVATGREVRRLSGQASQVGGVAYSPDGKYALTAANNEWAAILWDVATGRMLRRFTGHANMVQSVAFSPDGKRALTSSDDRTVRLWDVATGKELRRCTGHTREVWMAVFSPDGQEVLSAGHDSTVRLWDVESGEELLTLTGHRGIVYSVAFAPDGRRAVSVGQDRTVRLWDLETGEEVRNFDGHTGDVMSVAFSPDGARVVTGSRDMTVRLWPLPAATQPGPRGQVVVDSDTPAVRLLVKRAGRVVRELRTGSRRPAPLPAGEGYAVEPAEPRGLSVSPHQFALAAGATQRIEVRRGREYAGELARLAAPTGVNFALAFSPAGDRLLSSGGDNLPSPSAETMLRLWDVAGARLLSERPGPAGAGLGPAGLALATDGRRALVATNLSAQVRDLETGAAVCRLRGTGLGISTAAFLPGGGRVLTGDTDGKLRLWDAATGKELRRFDGHASLIRGVAVTRDGKRALSGSADGTVRLWDLEGGEELGCWTGHRGGVTGVALSPDGRWALSAGDDATVRLWDVATGKEVRRLLGHGGGILGAGFLSDGRRALTWSRVEPAFILWDVPEGRKLYTSPRLPAPVTGMAAAPDGLVAAWGGQDGAVRLWQVPDFAPDAGPPAGGELVVDLDGLPGTVTVRQGNRVVRTVTGPVRAGLPLEAGAYEVELGGAPPGVTLAPTRFTLAAGGQQVVGVRRGPEFVGVVRRISSDLGLGVLAPLPDGRHVLTSQGDGTLLLWDLEEGRVERRFPGHSGNVLDLAVTKDGARAVSVGADGTVRTWDLPAGKELASYRGGTGAVGAAALTLLPGDRQALCGLGNRLLVIDTRGATVVRAWPVSGPAPFVSLTLSPDARLALSGRTDGSVTLWDVADGKAVHSFPGHTREVLGVAFAPDGRLALSCGRDRTVRLWDVAGRKDLDSIHLSGTEANAGLFTPDGQRLVATCADGSVRVWGVAAREEVFRSFDAPGSSLAFTADGKRLLVGGPGRLAAWQLPGSDGTDGQVTVEGDPVGIGVRIKHDGQVVQTAVPGPRQVFNLKEGDYEVELAGPAGAAGPKVRLSAERVHVPAGRLRTVWVRRVAAPLVEPDPARVAAATKELKALGAGEPGTAAGRERLRADLVDFVRRYRGLPPALEAAEALRQLPSPLDRLDAARLPADVRALFGDDSPAGAGPALAAVFGDARLRHPGAMCVAFSPDGKVLASGGADGAVRLWDPDTGTAVRSLTGHQSEVLCLAFSPDGKRLTSAASDGAVRTWDLEGGKELPAVEGNEAMAVRSAFSPDGKWLATAGQGGVRVWAAGTGQEARAPLEEDPAFALAFSPDGKRLAAGLASGQMRVWEVGTWAEGPALQAHGATVFGLAFSPDGKRLASSGGDQAVKLWDPDAGKLVRSLPLAGGLPFALTFTPDGKQLVGAMSSFNPVAVGLTGGVLRVWDVEGKEVHDLAGAADPSVWALAFRKDGRLLASAGLGGMVQLWDPVAGAEVRPGAGHGVGHRGVVRALAFRGDGAVLASAGADGLLKVWDAAAGTEARSWAAHPGGAAAVAFSPDGRLLASGGADGKAVLWDAATGNQVRELPGHANGVTAVAFSPDGRTVATGGADHKARLSGVADGQLLRSLDLGAAAVTDLAFSPDGSLLASTGMDLQTRLWDVATGALRHTYQQASQGGHALAFSPDGRLLATGGWGGAVLLESASGAVVRQLNGAGAGMTLCLAFRPDGREVAVASMDGSIIVWDPETGEELTTLDGELNRQLQSRGSAGAQLRWAANSIVQMAYSPDGRYLAVSHNGGLVSVLRLAAAPVPKP